MGDYINKLKSVGVQLPNILIPRHAEMLEEWAVVACDQYTSDPAYWQSVGQLVEGVPSTLNLIYPECYLEEAHPEKRIARINETMKSYLADGIFKEYPMTMFLVYRETRPGFGRWGLITALDLEQYDYSADSVSLIRATEGTIIERIPPRKRIRKDALLEFPHILVLIDDEQRSVIEPLAAKKEALEQVYSFDLMKDSGSIEAYAVQAPEDLESVADALLRLADQSAFQAKYGSDATLLFAMGDGNHSLATAKSCWEDIKQDLTAEERETHPARYALVEIENIFDDGLVFEPIHRVLFDADTQQMLAELERHCSSYSIETVPTLDAMTSSIAQNDDLQYFGMVDGSGTISVVRIEGAQAHIVAGTLQSTLDAYVGAHDGVTIDYTHGIQITSKLGSENGNIGIFLPGLPKHEFFSSIVNDGALPRKTFSMGEDYEKRFYIEGRKIKA